MELHYNLRNRSIMRHLFLIPVKSLKIPPLQRCLAKRYSFPDWNVKIQASAFFDFFPGALRSNTMVRNARKNFTSSMVDEFDVQRSIEGRHYSKHLFDHLINDNTRGTIMRFQHNKPGQGVVCILERQIDVLDCFEPPIEGSRFDGRECILARITKKSITL